ncbi:MAG: hypothetical protein ACQEVT_15960 [Pseudomonadota bacterium]|uniref:hypothetical protein n=1 Tax=Roseovarius sp. TaxID=1486281 RepID=UPI00356373DA
MKRLSAGVTLAVTLGQLLAGRRDGWSKDQLLVLEALRRSASELEGADEETLAAYLADFSPEQMRGIVSNIKGIYHELLVTRAENIDGDKISAVMFEATNHPGADIEFMMDGNVIREVQLKAVQSRADILEALERYPDTDVFATSEVAALLGGAFGSRVTDSGFSNTKITNETRETLEALIGEDLSEFVSDGLLTSSLLGGAIVARSVLAGSKPSGTDVRSFLESAGVGVGTAFVTDTLLEFL